MRRALEPAPLLVAAGIGAAAMVALCCWSAARAAATPNIGGAAWRGALVGLLVQLGVRLLGVS